MTKSTLKINYIHITYLILIFQIFAPPWNKTHPTYTFTVLEEQPIGTILTSLQASDEDSSIEGYFLSENNYFEINSNTGIAPNKNKLA